MLAAGNPSVVAVVAAGKERSQKVVPEDQEQQHLAGDDQIWPPPGSHLFCIGTLGNDELPEQEDLPEFTVDEVRKLQDALARILQRARSKRSEAAGAGADSGLPLDRFLNCPSSLELDRGAQLDHGGGDGGDLSPDTKMILTKARGLLIDSGSTTTSSSKTKNMPFKYMLKKMFVCQGGFLPARSLKDPTESTMEKCIRSFRTVLGKKIFVRTFNSPASRMYHLEDKNTRGDDSRRRRPSEEKKKEEDSCRWDRTDSEYIVLEI
ncbi:hypothetical protein GUJ93_ZPchr0003g17072 [Zizania palustris]|uniref:NGR2 n=1 Tax=Zizania palustris TaxID=103762 RepID=A0A8J5VY44_ZIZPA|nr:hypothetical protein GUJ93_ZPchr0003g17072 [Zizania palustris]KAG8063079.1 hypothetical protein GUJ93_ZPchr0003g17072 [Zizania palustris]